MEGKLSEGLAKTPPSRTQQTASEIVKENRRVRRAELLRIQKRNKKGATFIGDAQTDKIEIGKTHLDPMCSAI